MCVNYITKTMSKSCRNRTDHVTLTCHAVMPLMCYSYKIIFPLLCLPPRLFHHNQPLLGRKTSNNTTRCSNNERLMLLPFTVDPHIAETNKKHTACSYAIYAYIYIYIYIYICIYIYIYIYIGYNRPMVSI